MLTKHNILCIINISFERKEVIIMKNKILRHIEELKKESDFLLEGVLKYQRLMQKKRLR